MGLVKMRDWAEQRCFTNGLDGTEGGGSRIPAWFKYETKSSKDLRLPRSELESPVELAAGCSEGQTHAGSSHCLAFWRAVQSLASQAVALAEVAIASSLYLLWL